MAYWSLYYHFVWGTKNREALILPEFEARLYRVMAAKVVELGGCAHAIGGIADHVHLAVSSPPKVALATLAGEIKGASSHFVNHVIRPGFSFRWQAEYAVFSFREQDLPGIADYIRRQRQRHADGSLLGYLENLSQPEGLG